ncbi:hypothetical protein LJC71_08440 [Desulfosarcina sp. OttesenSCG-928-A07]|nr:hypothetical protein [Desulfosarcina sp. OttesenSCG-928-G17]MDL2329753.1 hypothetical protein [Desulfosarcina sp. OttesenSCG-928-A07]
MAYRSLKRRVIDLLEQADFSAAHAEMLQLPARQVVNPLFSCLYAKDELVRWRAVTAMGVVVGHMGETSMESARVVMRRLMWNLNDESGGIGWGSPEAMGEIIAVHAGLAREYGRILISYINPNGNFLEHETLQRGALWGVGRMAHAWPEQAKPAAEFLPLFFTASDPYLRGISVWALTPIIEMGMVPRLMPLCSDPASLRLYRDGQLSDTTVSGLAHGALAHVGISC